MGHERQAQAPIIADGSSQILNGNLERIYYYPRALLHQHPFPLNQ